ncbi:Os11g0606900 [Oryza sativa Japonica Group]|uniref:Os11g0606900 protein n=1 Tax=Oryza sativa subsp. japonica TaxID=39947 RepID=Q0IRP9_ORYSJ|nr:Os11g0606900 [Oryza sativa Japonica Group]|eukprot:NP_001068253.1 Os11g0606900 [Oryza sativa Japonica Group]
MDLVVGASSEAVKSLTGKLGSLLAQEYTLIAGVRDDIQYINDELASMQAFLSKLKRRDVDHDEQRQDWMKQVREVAYDIKDCVDDVGHRLGREPRGSGAAISFQRAWYLLTTLYKRRRIAAEIGNLKLRAQHVSERRTRYGVENLQGNGGGGGSGSGLGVGANAPRDRLAPLPRLIGTMEPVGMDAAIDELQEWFSKGKDGTQQRYLAIVGFGGLGKTTLAMALYRKLGDEFDCRAFVLASQKFHLPTVLRSLVKQFHEKQADASEDTLHGIEGWGDEMLKKKLLEQLTGKRYHILVDDIWSVSAWENIRDSFPKSDKGSCVVVTTRFNSVAEACRRQQGHVHKLKQLDPESSYNLFLQIISANDLCPIRPINARIIMKTCGGLPLAIVVVAGLIASKMKSKIDLTLDQHLVDVDEALSAELGSNLTTEGVTQIINHCYKNLPPDLKTCLLYLSTFPKGRSISRKHLIRRWIAEGFITEEHGKTAEEVAEDSLNELIGRNLIKPIKNSSNGRVKSCQIHDMVLQYIVSKSSDENFIAVIGGHWQTPLPSYKVRRLSVHKSDKQETDMVERMKLSHVRSLTVLESFSALHSTMLKFQILQVLDLDGCKDLSHPHQLKKICNMYQLKYLGLRRTDIDKIPKNIGRLEYLEVLDIRETNVRKLPTSFAKLQRMTHLLAGNKSKRTALKLTEEITKVVALQTLSGIEISGSSTLEEDREQPRDMPIRHSTTTRAEERGNTALHGPHKEASKVDLPKQLRPLEALEKLTNLKKLAIYKLVKFQAKDDELLLSAIEHLSSCSLKFLAIDDSFTGFLESSLSSSQAAPEHLYTLELSGMLSKAPGWIDRLHNLEKLTLSLTSLKTDTLVVLSSLPELFSLTFSLHAADNDSNALKIIHRNTMKSGGKIFVLDEGFEKLKLLHFAAPVLPSLSFLEGAMPELQRLELRFRMVDYMYGLENLSKLQQNQAPILSSYVKYKNCSVAAALQDYAWVATGQYQRGVILASRLGFICPQPTLHLLPWWLAVRKTICKQEQRAFNAGVILVTWLIWKEQNARVFEGKATMVFALCVVIIDEWRMWKVAALFTLGLGCIGALRVLM